MTSKILRMLDSTIGQKVIAGLTGIGLIVFLVVHLAGNLQIFAGADTFNSYAEKLKSMGPILWVGRIGLLTVFALHIAMTIRIKMRSMAARTDRYAKIDYQTSNVSSRWMAISGIAILVFVIFHLLHFTLGVVRHSTFDVTDDSGRHDVFKMVTDDLSNPLLGGVYVIAMLVVGAHLRHAVYSVFQTLGLNRSGKEASLQRSALIVAAVLTIGFITIPVAILAKLVT